MLEVKGITVQYGTNPPALANFSLALRKGDILCLVGESGSGKSTVLSAIMGILPGKGRVTEGDILLDGKSVLSMKEREWETIRGRRIAAVPQSFGSTLDPIATIGSQFTEYIRAHQKISKIEARNMATEMLRSVQLPDPGSVMNSYPFQLSGGMCQRVGIAMALFFQPEYLLADEPTSALDVTTQAQIVRQIMELRKRFDAGILLVTHNLALAAYVSDNICVLRNGRIVDRGSRDEVLNRPGDAYTKNLLDSVPSIGGVRYV